MAVDLGVTISRAESARDAEPTGARPAGARASGAVYCGAGRAARSGSPARAACPAAASLLYENQNGGISIDRVVWDRSEKAWRRREWGDGKGRLTEGT